MSNVKRLFDFLDGDAILHAKLGDGDIAQAYQMHDSSTFPTRCVRFWGAGLSESIQGAVSLQGFVIAVMAKDGMLAADDAMRATLDALRTKQEGGLLKVDIDGAVGPYWSDELQLWRSDVRVVFLTTY